MIHPDCLWIPSPNYGYPRGVLKQLTAAIKEAKRSGEFWHSMVGSLAAAKNRFLNPAEEASAHFLFPRDGIPTQMVDSDDAAWHAGGRVADDPLPGGATIGSLANLYFHGFEFEGGAPGNYSEPLTENQIEWGIKITRWLRGVHNTPQIYVRRETLWEHNEVTPTACPSGRIPWERVINELEDDMLNDEDKLYLAGLGRSIVRAIATGTFSSGLRNGDDEYTQAERDLGDVMKAIAGIRAGSGLTEEEAVEANKKAAREGTG